MSLFICLNLRSLLYLIRQVRPAVLACSNSHGSEPNGETPFAIQTQGGRSQRVFQFKQRRYTARRSQESAHRVLRKSGCPPCSGNHDTVKWIIMRWCACLALKTVQQKDMVQTYRQPLETGIHAYKNHENYMMPQLSGHLNKIINY